MSGRAICVYCASATDDPAALQLADALGAEIGRRGWQLALLQREVVDTEADELIVTDTMHERKRIMAARADAFITLTGMRRSYLSAEALSQLAVAVDVGTALDICEGLPR